MNIVDEIKAVIRKDAAQEGHGFALIKHDQDADGHDVLWLAPLSHLTESEMRKAALAFLPNSFQCVTLFSIANGPPGLSVYYYDAHVTVRIFGSIQPAVDIYVLQPAS